ncbi:hypothetical protein AB0D23_48965, partial [Streptomyces umbrinus]
GEYLLGGATSSSFPCSGQPYWVPVRKLRGPSDPVPPAPTALLAQGLTGDPFLACPRRHSQPMVASLDGQRPALRTPGPDRRSHHRTRHRPLPPDLTNYR